MTPAAKYQAKNIRQFKFSLNRRTATEMVAWMEGQENVQGYLKSLVKKDMEEIEISRKSK